MAPEKNSASKKQSSSIKHRGPVQLRRKRKDEKTTTDQRLLDKRGPTDWVHTDPWRVLRIQSEFIEGFGALAEVPRAVTVFGSARTTVDHPEYQSGRELGTALAEAGYAVITGGGPGVMEAANRGCSEAGGYSIGLGIELPFEQGGFGTLDELFEALTLVQTHKVTRFPIVLFGTEYWSGLVDWIRGTLERDGKISEGDVNLLHVTDSVEEAVRIVLNADKGVDEAADLGKEEEW